MYTDVHVHRDRNYIYLLIVTKVIGLLVDKL